MQVRPKAGVTVRPDDGQDNRFERLVCVVEGLTRNFPEGNAPFLIIARLGEEAGELVRADNHVERGGVTLQQDGPSDHGHLADRVRCDVGAAHAVARHDGLVRDGRRSGDQSRVHVHTDGYLPSAQVSSCWSCHRFLAAQRGSCARTCTSGDVGYGLAQLAGRL